MLGFNCYISGITNEKVGLFAKTSQSQSQSQRQANPYDFIAEPLPANAVRQAVWVLSNRQQPKANSQPPTANSQKPTANSQPPTANSQ